MSNSYHNIFRLRKNINRISSRLITMSHPIIEQEAMPKTCLSRKTNFSSFQELFLLWGSWKLTLNLNYFQIKNKTYMNNASNAYDDFEGVLILWGPLRYFVHWTHDKNPRTLILSLYISARGLLTRFHYEQNILSFYEYMRCFFNVFHWL